MIEVLRRQTPKARTSHVCGHCRQRIEPGTVYELIACADSGQAWTFKAHQECSDLFNRYGRYWALGEYDLVDWHDVVEWAARQENVDSPTPGGDT